jgi:DNA-binding transcriptional LysR family regulator
VTIACGDTVALYLLPPVLSDLRTRFPDRVHVRNHGSVETTALVLAGTPTSASRRNERLGDALESAPLLEELLVLALPPGHRLAATGPATIAELDGESAVLLAPAAVTRAVIDEGLRAAGVRLTPAMESGNLEVVKAYVARGFGLSILPAMAVTDDDRRRMAIHPLPATFPKRKLVVLRRKDRWRSRLVVELTALLASHTKVLRPPGKPGKKALPRAE